MGEKREKTDRLEDKDLILVAKVTAAHGIKGQVKIQSFTGDPEAFLTYGPLVDDSGDEIAVEIEGGAKGQFIAWIEGISDRNGAEGMKGMNLYALRKNLGLEEDEILTGDLIGFEILDEADESFGSVRRVLNYGAGDLLEVRMGDMRTYLIPYTEQYIRDIDTENNRITVLGIDSLLDLGGIKR